MSTQPHRTRWRQPAVIAVAALLVTVIGVLSQGRQPTPPAPTDAVHLFFEDPAGLPEADIVALGRDGQDRHPDWRGEFDFTVDEIGQSFDVLDRDTRRRLTSFTVQPGSSGAQRVVVTR